MAANDIFSVKRITDAGETAGVGSVAGENSKIVPLNPIETSTDAIAVRSITEAGEKRVNFWDRIQSDFGSVDTIEGRFDLMCLVMMALNSQSEDFNARQRMNMQDRYDKATANVAASYTSVKSWMGQLGEVACGLGQGYQAYHGVKNSAWGVGGVVFRPLNGMAGSWDQANRTTEQAQQQLAQTGISGSQSEERSLLEKQRHVRDTLIGAWQERQRTKQSILGA